MAAERVWNCKDALEWTIEYLARKGDETPRRSAEWLLSAATGLSRVEIYAFFDRPLSPEERTRFRELIERRAQGMPLQYVSGEMPFRHLVMHVEPGVFIPRPETEVLVDAVLSRMPRAPLVVDLCTGSGCVAVSIAHECPDATVYATELGEVSVEAARRNALYAEVSQRVQVIHGDLFSPLSADLQGRVDIVVSNPPYIPSADIQDLPGEVLGFEPHLALDGGPDGLDVARRIWAEARTWLKPGGVLVMELDSGRVQAAAEALRADYIGIEVLRDLTGKDRIVVARNGEAMEL